MGTYGSAMSRVLDPVLTGAKITACIDSFYVFAEHYDVVNVDCFLLRPKNIYHIEANNTVTTSRSNLMQIQIENQI